MKKTPEYEISDKNIQHEAYLVEANETFYTV